MTSSIIEAKLKSPEQKSEAVIDAFRGALEIGRKEAADKIVQARKRARDYTQRAKTKGFNIGYNHGLKQCHDRFEAALAGLLNQYDQAVNDARHDVLKLGTQLLETIIPAYLKDHPEQLCKWIDEAMVDLKGIRKLILRYHPRHQEFLHDFKPSKNIQITCICDSSLDNTEFALSTDHGEILFNWRQLLAELAI